MMVETQICNIFVVARKKMLFKFFKSVAVHYFFLTINNITQRVQTSLSKAAYCLDAQQAGDN